MNNISNERKRFFYHETTERLSSQGRKAKYTTDDTKQLFPDFKKYFINTFQDIKDCTQNLKSNSTSIAKLILGPSITDDNFNYFVTEGVQDRVQIVVFSSGQDQNDTFRGEYLQYFHNILKLDLNGTTGVSFDNLLNFLRNVQALLYLGLDNFPKGTSENFRLLLQKIPSSLRVLTVKAWELKPYRINIKQKDQGNIRNVTRLDLSQTNMKVNFLRKLIVRNEKLTRVYGFSYNDILCVQSKVADYESSIRHIKNRMRKTNDKLILDSNGGNASDFKSKPLHDQFILMKE